MTFLLYVPILVGSGLATITDNGVVRSVDLATLFRALPTMIAETARFWSLGFTTPLAIVLAIAALGPSRCAGREPCRLRGRSSPSP